MRLTPLNVLGYREASLEYPRTPPTLTTPALPQNLGVTIAYLGTELLERTTIRLGNGRRYGLVGANGVGKTTLLRRIAAGAVPGWPLHMRSYLVQQEEAVCTFLCRVFAGFRWFLHPSKFFAFS